MNTTKRAARWRTPLLVLAGVRTLLGIIAIPLAPALYEDHFVLLVLLRPTKEVLLAGGFLLRRHEVNLVSLLAAAVPLAIFGVWHFYFLGRAFSKEIQSGKGLPKWAEKVLPPKRIKAMGEVLDKKGARVVFLGRLAAFPSALMAAAAGASEMSIKDFLIADGLGGLASIAEVLVAGYVFGAAYKRAGPWLTGVGIAALAALLVFMGRWLKRQEAK
jgi:membrane protein DedA with SNARE-associated domain